MPERFLHDHPDFKTLLEITSREEEILEPSLVEKDYWIMHVLWGLSAQGLKYELKGEMRTSGLVWREIAKPGRELACRFFRDTRAPKPNRRNGQQRPTRESA